ncbi:MAG: formate dehydrogenase subunit gamma [Nitrospirota bacterium]
MRPQTRIRRFSPLQRLFHLFLMLTFLTQASTGLARMFIETRWGKNLAGFFGGYEICRTIHIYVGIFMLCGFALHAAYVLSRINWRQFPRSLFGPDSLLLQFKDLKEFLLHVGWFLNVTRGPEFDRWGYWEKFDYWAVFWGIPVLGITGLLLAYPLSASQIMPGWALNIAFWIHRIEAILAMCHVFIIHFFIGHLRPHSFPMDQAMFAGSVDVDDARHERPMWIARLEHAGTLQSALVPAPSAAGRAVFYVFGYLAMATGVFLLIGGLVNAPFITW